MTDHRIAPPDSATIRDRPGNGPELRATRANLSVLAAAEQQTKYHELEKAKIAKRIGKREIALLAAGSAWGGISAVKDRDKAVLETAEKFLVWLGDADA